MGLFEEPDADGMKKWEIHTREAESDAGRSRKEPLKRVMMKNFAQS